MLSATRAAKGSDLIHCHWTATGLVADLGKHGSPFTCRTVGARVRHKRYDKQTSPERVNKYVYGVVDRVLAVSEDIAGVLKGVGVGREKIKIVHNGVDARFKPHDKATSRSALRSCRPTNF